MKYFTLYYPHNYCVRRTLWHTFLKLRLAEELILLTLARTARDSAWCIPSESGNWQALYSDSHPSHRTEKRMDMGGHLSVTRGSANHPIILCKTAGPFAFQIGYLSGVERFFDLMSLFMMENNKWWTGMRGRLISFYCIKYLVIL